MRLKRWLSVLLMTILLCTSIDISVFASEISEVVQTEESTEIFGEYVESTEEVLAEEEVPEKSVQESVEEVVQSVEDNSEADDTTTTEGYQLTYQVLEDGTAEITGYTGTATGDLIIPGVIDGYTVTKIGEYAFRDKYGTMFVGGKLVLPDSITDIGDYAFYCVGFTGDLIIPNSVTSIGNYSFRSCTGFTGDLIIPNSVTSIGDYAFGYCNGFTGNLIISDSVTEIGDSAFINCNNFTGNLIISDSVTEIGNSAFECCSGFTGNLIIPNGVTSIGDYAFLYCRGFTGDLIIPDSVTEIGYWAFYGCTGFTGNLKISNSVTSIDDCAFCQCKGFTGDLIIPDSVMSIGEGAFYSCEGFTGNLKISNSVTKIGNNAFSLCSGFTGRLILQENLTQIGEGAFFNCSGFTGDLIIPDSVTKIGNNAFQACGGFTGNLIIPDSVTEIGNSAFANCGGFTGNLVIPETMTNIGIRTFAGCSGLSNTVYIKGYCDLGADTFGTSITTIYGLSGSPAETYAKEHDIEFIPYNPGGPDNTGYTINDRVVHVYVSDSVTGKFLNNAIVNDIVCENYDGYVMLELEEDYQKINFVASAEGYYDFSFEKDVYKGEVIFIDLLPTTNWGVVSAKAKVGTWGATNILRDTFILEHTTEDAGSSANRKTLTIDIKAKGDIATYELLQDGVIIASGPDSELSIPVIEEEGIIKTNLVVNKPITIRVINSYGSKTSVVTGLRVEEVGTTRREGDGSVSLGKALELEVPSDVPFVGGMELEYGFKKNIPIQVKYSETDGKIRVALNMYSRKETEWKEEYDRLEEEAKKASEIASAFGPPQSFGAGYLSSEVSIVGYGEGYIDNDNDTVINVGIIVSGKTGGQYTHYFMAGVVPIYLSIKGEAGVSGDFSIDGLRIADESVSIDSFGLGKVGVTVSIVPSAGVGVKDFLSVGISGKGSLNIEGNFKNDIVKAWLDGSLTLYGEAFGAELSWSTPKAKYTIGEMPLISDNNATNTYAMNNVISKMYDSTSYRLMDRGYLQDNQALSISAENEGYVQTSVYPGASPQLVNVNDILYLFWLQDISTRTAENRAALVYSTSMDGNNWTVPKQVVNETANQTMDGDYDVVVWDGKIYICWQDAAEIFETGKTLNEMIQRLYISYAVLDGATGEVLKTETVTESAGAYFMPQIGVQNENVKIAFVDNAMTTEGGIWNTNNTHSLMLYDAGNDTLTTLTVGSGLEKIVSMDMISSDAEAGVIYVVDNDGKYQTLDDRMVCMDNRNAAGSGMQQYLTSQAGQTLGVTAAGNRYYWNTDGNIHYITEGNTESGTFYAENVVVPSDFSVVTDGNKTTLLWEEICPETEKVIINGIRSTESGWTLPFVLEETNSDMTSDFSGVYKDGKLYYTYLHVAKQEDGSYIRSICFDQEQSRKNISLDYAEYEIEDFIKGEVLPITAYITNKGNEAIDNVNVYWDDTLLGNAEVSIPVGETTTVKLDNYTVPEDIAGYEEHVLTVSAEGESDSSDNDYLIEIGETEVAITVSQRLKDGETWVDVGVYNTSCISTDVTFNIRADYKDGEILYTEELGTIEGGKGIALTQTLEDYEEDYCTYYVEAVSTVPDALEGNNIEFVYTGAGRDVEGGELGYKTVYYSVTFDSNGGSAIESQTIEKGVFVSEPMPPVKDNHHFDGWYYNGEPYDFSTPVESDITLTAQWTEYETLAVPSANIESGSTVEAGTKIALTCAASGASIYYTLDGSVPTTASNLYVEPITLLENTVIKAIAVQSGYYNSDVAEFTYEVVEKQNVYIVAFESNGGSVVESQEVTENECAVKPADPVREGYKFLGWYIGDELYDFAKPVTENLRLEAKWEETESDTPEDGEDDIPEDAPGDVFPEDIPEGGVEAIPEGLWVAGVDKDGYSYTGSAIKPVVRVYDHKTLLTEKKDYTISYKNNKKAYTFVEGETGYNSKKVPTITVKGKGNYAGTEKITFKILPLDITGEDFIVDDLTTPYNSKKVQKLVPTVLWKNKKLKNKTDFKVTYPDAGKDGAYKEAGTYDIQIEGYGNYTGKKTITLEIVKTISMSKVAVKNLKSQEYTGSPIEPTFTVQYGKDTLEKDVHYTVTYEKNTEVGIGYVVLTGKGDYTGQKRAAFKITGWKMNQAKVTSGLPKSVDYDGTAHTPECTLQITVKGVTKTLNKDTDYTVSYDKNIQAGTAAVIFTGKGGYSGTLKKTFKINKFDVTKDENNLFTVEEGITAVYAKGGSKPEPVVKYKDTVLTEGIDYTLSYKNNKALHDGVSPDKQPQVIVKGKGSFAGSKSVPFAIAGQDIGKLVMNVADKVYSTKKNGFKSTPKVYDLDGKLLKAGTDYKKEVAYTYKNETTLANGTVRNAGAEVDSMDIVPEGTIILVTVYGDKNYSEKLTGEYEILKKGRDISKASIKISPQDYTGKAIKLDKTDVKVKLNGGDLDPVNFEIVDTSYKNHVKKGTATVTIRGVGEYGGSKTVKFTIKAKKFEWWKAIAEQLFG